MPTYRGTLCCADSKERHLAELSAGEYKFVLAAFGNGRVGLKIHLHAPRADDLASTTRSPLCRPSHRIRGGHVIEGEFVVPTSAQSNHKPFIEFALTRRIGSKRVDYELECIPVIETCS